MRKPVDHKNKSAILRAEKKKHRNCEGTEQLQNTENNRADFRKNRRTKQ